MDQLGILSTIWPIFVLAGVLFAAGLVIQILRGNKKEDLSVYKRKDYLFDNVSEFNLFKTLVELFGDKYHVFPQVHYSHLLEPKKGEWKEESRLRSKIDRKSADFVLCDKERVVPKLIIELDGSSHNLEKKQRRDEFINELTKVAGLPLLHLTPNKMDREFVKAEVEKALGAKSI